MILTYLQIVVFAILFLLLLAGPITRICHEPMDIIFASESKKTDFLSACVHNCGNVLKMQHWCIRNRGINLQKNSHRSRFCIL